MARHSGESRIVKYLGAVSVKGQHTDIALLKFTDKWLIVLTQLEKIGSLVSVTSDVVVPGSVIPVYNSRVLFGRDEPQIHAFGRTLAEKLGTNLPILLSIALSEQSILIENFQVFLCEILSILKPVIKPCS